MAAKPTGVTEGESSSSSKMDAPSLKEHSAELYTGESSTLMIRRRLRKRKVKGLEKKLELYQRKIREMMETEVTLDEMNTDTSAYLKEDVLKIKFMNTWYELCDLLKISYDIQLDDKESLSPYTSTPYSQLNRRIDRLLSLDTFPDYWDIVKLIERVNKKYSLGIEEKEKLSLSQTVFQEVGERIKSIREKTWRSLFGCHLTDKYMSYEDPALTEPTLLDRLMESADKGKIKLNKIIDDFATRQEIEGHTHSDPQQSSSSEGEETERETEGERDSKRQKFEDNSDSSHEEITYIETINGKQEGDTNKEDDDIIIVQLTDTEHSSDNDIIILSD